MSLLRFCIFFAVVWLETSGQTFRKFTVSKNLDELSTKKSQFFHLAKDLPRCRAGDNTCLPKVITDVLKKLKNGNAELNLPPFDPLYIPIVNIIQGKEKESSNIQLELQFQDCKLYGISEAIINKTV